MDVAAIADELADLLLGIPDLRAFSWVPERVEPPCAVVTWPASYHYDETMGRGSDRMELPVLVMVGDPDDRSARDNLAKYLNPLSPASIKVALEGGYPYSNLDNLRVTDVAIEVTQVAGIDYLTARFTVDVIGNGA